MYNPAVQEAQLLIVVVFILYKKSSFTGCGNYKSYHVYLIFQSQNLLAKESLYRCVMFGPDKGTLVLRGGWPCLRLYQCQLCRWLQTQSSLHLLTGYVYILIQEVAAVVLCLLWSLLTHIYCDDGARPICIGGFPCFEIEIKYCLKHDGTREDITGSPSSKNSVVTASHMILSSNMLLCYPYFYISLRDSCKYSVAICISWQIYHVQFKINECKASFKDLLHAAHLDEKPESYLDSMHVYQGILMS